MDAEAGDCSEGERAGKGCIVNCSLIKDVVGSLIDDISLVGGIGGSLAMDIGEEFGGWRGGELNKPGVVESSDGPECSGSCARGGRCSD